jgi:hypothetical protein
MRPHRNLLTVRSEASMGLRGAYTPRCRTGQCFERQRNRRCPCDCGRDVQTPFPCAGPPDHQREMFGRCRLGSTAIGKTQFRTFDPSPHPPTGPGGGGCADVLASPLGWASLQRVQACIKWLGLVDELNGDSGDIFRFESVTSQERCKAKFSRSSTQRLRVASCPEGH